MITLDLFTKKSRLYYIGLIGAAIIFSFIAVAAFFNLQFKSPFMPLFDTMLIVCSLASAAFLCIAGTGLLRIYVKDGELILAEDFVSIDTVKIPSSEINKVILTLAPRTKKSFILTNNTIEISDKRNNNYKRRFAIKSYDQNQEFVKILDSWHAQGVVLLVYHI